MNHKNLIEFQENLNTILENHNVEKGYISFVLPIYLTIVAAFSYATYWIWSGELGVHPTFIDFLVFSGRFMIPSVGIVLTLFGIPLVIKSFVNSVKTKKKKMAYKQVSGENIKNYFNDLYFLFSENNRDNKMLEEVVNNLARNEELSDNMLTTLNRNLVEKLTLLEKVERNKVNFFQEYKEKLEKQILNNSTQENISFFEKNQ